MKNLITMFFVSISFMLFSQENIDLFIWAGQSNAQGRQGDASGYPGDVNELDNQIRFNWTVANGSNSGGWTMMQPQIGFFPAGHFGGEVTFSRKLVQAGFNPAIFKYTQGATSLFQHWQGPGDGGLYDNMIAAVNTAITALENQGHTVSIRGFIWVQGESDSNSQAAASAYFSNLSNMINDLRSNVVQDTNLPIILGVDEQFFNLSGHQQPEILNAHQDIALGDEHIKFSSMYGYPKADVTHLTPEGLIRYGEDLFDTFQLLLSGNKPLENAILSSVGTQLSFERRSWGQSFTTDHSGNLSSIIFKGGSAINGSATLIFRNSADCSGTILHTQSINSITTGHNEIIINTNLYLDKEHTYFFEITSDINEDWRINYSNIDNVFGMLRSSGNDNSCGTSFPSFDMDFSIILATPVPCSDNANVHSFVNGGKSYEVIKVNRTWADAVACAIERGGKLAEINDLEEQNAIFNALQNDAGIILSNTLAIEGGGAAYVWLGGNDLGSEGQWLWDGNNDDVGPQFWQGGPASAGGIPVGGLFSNWGNEPDNAGNKQDVLGLALTQWPINSGSIGSAGQWNDLDASNTLYAVVEYSTIIGTSEREQNELLVYPNPVKNILRIQNRNNQPKDIRIINSLGQTIEIIVVCETSKIVEIDFSTFKDGLYFIYVAFENGKTIVKKVIK